MAKYIFTARNDIHIINLEDTVVLIDKAYDYIKEMASQGKTILFVGTKKQAQKAIEDEAKRCGMFYINSRWLGGTLTNFKTIRSRIERLNKLEQMEKVGEFNLLPKKEVIKLRAEMEKLERNLGGIKEMTKLPYFSASSGAGMVTQNDYYKATPYDSLLENTGLGSSRAKKESNIKAYALKKISGMDISDFSEDVDSGDITIAYSGNIFMRKISVCATKNFLNPMGNMMEFLGVSGRDERTMHASSTVSDPPDFIRLMDQIWEVAEDLKKN